MTPQLVLFVVIIGLLAAIPWLIPVFVSRRRQRLKQRPFPLDWQILLEKYLPCYRSLLGEERYELQGHIQVLLAEKQFIGCGGLQVTFEMKFAIAAVSALLLMNGQSRYFAKLRSILVYPNTYLSEEKTWLSPYVMSEKKVARLGESWHAGQVVLSWAQVEWDLDHWHDGHNVILHEFAHQLDAEDASAAGVPPLPSRGSYRQWAQVMGTAYEQLTRAVENRESPKKASLVIDSYGATNPAEFFAVATETFFEKPRQLVQSHPQLYNLLQAYYQLDPQAW